MILTNSTESSNCLPCAQYTYVCEGAVLTAGHVHSAYQMIHSSNLLLGLDDRPRGELCLPHILPVWQLWHATTRLSVHVRDKR